MQLTLVQGGSRGDACYTADHGPRDTNTDNEVFSGPIPRGDHLAGNNNSSLINIVQPPWMQ